MRAQLWGRAWVHTASKRPVAPRDWKARSSTASGLTIGALEPADDRTVELWVAGAGALLVAKVHKIAERVGDHDRVRDKDALDVLRPLRSVSTEDLADRRPS